MSAAREPLGALAPSVQLLRGFAVDFLTAHDAAAARRIMADGYTLHIGGHTLAGRDSEYLPATVAQLEQFPGLSVTVHDVVAGPGFAAMRFTEHGASLRDGGRVAAWGGVTLFRVEDGRLARGWAEEDYFARKRQLKSGAPDAVRPPAAAAWDAPCLPRDPATEDAVRRWLAAPAALQQVNAWDEISAEGPALSALLRPTAVEVDALFTAGPRAAVHLTLRGADAGGFGGPAGGEAVVRLAALMDVEGERVARVQAAVDRLGLQRSLGRRATGAGA